MSRITFTVSGDEHKFIKAQAAMNGLTIKDYFLSLHHSRGLLGHETLEAMQELEDDREVGELKIYNSSEELWNDLEV